MLNHQSMLAKVLDDYCNEAGIPEGHSGRRHLQRQVLSLYRSGIVDPAELKAKMNDGYDAWLGETGDTGRRMARPRPSAEDRSVGDNILPGSDRRGAPL
jgi:hypothetical protein